MMGYREAPMPLDMQRDMDRAWERRRRVQRMRDAGMTFRDIQAITCLSAARLSQMANRKERDTLPPSLRQAEWGPPQLADFQDACIACIRKQRAFR